MHVPSARIPSVFGACPARLVAAVGLALMMLTGPSSPALAQLRLSPWGQFWHPPQGGYGAAEIVAHDPQSQRLYVANHAANALDVISLADPRRLQLWRRIPLDQMGAGPTSVAAHQGLLAVAMVHQDRCEPGQVAFFDRDGQFLAKLRVGALPDMLTFTPDGKMLLVANEGEPSDDYLRDPEGSVSLIDLSQGVVGLSDRHLTHVGFAQYRRADLDPSIRAFGPRATVAQDFEPEFIATSPDSQRAWVVLQENNAIAEIDLRSKRVVRLTGLGWKDHRLKENALDVCDLDGAPATQNWPVLGLYQPDAIAAFEADGKSYLVTANEGDSRDYAGFSEQSRLSELKLDSSAFADADLLQREDRLGRLFVSNAMGDHDGDGDFDQLFTFGGRSFSIWDDKCRLVYDSGSLLEELTATLEGDYFNADSYPDGASDQRSDDKGPEPEGVAIGRIAGRSYLFLGLERQGAILVFDISDPRSPRYETHVLTRGARTVGSHEDLGPEGLCFISGDESPNGTPLLVVAYEASGTTRVFGIERRVPQISQR